MKMTLTKIVASAALLTFVVLPPSFAAAQESSSSGTQVGVAACYSRRLIGHRTSSGQRYNPDALTAAHATLPIGTRVKVTNTENGQSVAVLVNDRLSKHPGGGIIIDISGRACKELKFGPGGEAKVKLQVISSKAAAKPR